MHPFVRGDHQSNAPGAPYSTNDWLVAVTIVAGLAACAGLIFGLAAWMNRAVASLHIIRTPPGEAPEEIRRAWVGAKLPLRSCQKKPGLHGSVGVLSHLEPQWAMGYAVCGRAAVKALASHSPEAAAWWREYAPHVLARGYQLWFPCDVCEVIESPHRSDAS
jgi:hypothetical protein